MPEPGRKRCLVAIDAANGPLLIEVELDAAASVAAALESACALDLTGAATGIWGLRCEPTAVPRDGDRIEVYRPLPVDPREQRRHRAARRPGRAVR